MKTFLIGMLSAFCASLFLLLLILPLLKRLKAGQYILGYVKEHKDKGGTPTMGGILIMIAVVITSLLYVRDFPKIIPILFLTLGFGLIGFVDDYIKVVLRRSMGLRAWQKMLGQFVVTGLFPYYVIN